jgi:hypothetical protein
MNSVDRETALSSLPDTPDLFFNHVPKCAGTSIGTLLESAYPADTVLTSRLVSPAVIRTISDDELARHRLIWGHFTDLARRRSPGRYNVVTLRDPWKRFRSILRHALRERGGQWRNFRAVEPYAETLDPKLLETPEFKRVAGVLPSYTHLSPTTRENARATPRERVDEAIAALDAYDLIITDDTIDTCAGHLADMLGLPPIVAAPRHNAANAWPDSLRADPPREHEPLLGEHHALDSEFYAIARERSLKQAAEVARPLEERTQRYLERLAARSTKREWTLDWAEPVCAAGWSARVPPGIVRDNDKETLCQIAGSSAFIDAPVVSSGKLAIDLVMSASDEARGNLEITIDGAAVAWEHKKSRTAPTDTLWHTDTPVPAGTRGVRIGFELPDQFSDPRDLPWLRGLRVKAN